MEDQTGNHETSIQISAGPGKLRGQCVARLLKPPLEIPLTLQILEGCGIWFFVFGPKKSKDDSAQSHPFLGEKKKISLEALWIKQIKNVSLRDIPSSCFNWTGLHPLLSPSFRQQNETNTKAGRQAYPHSDTCDENSSIQHGMSPILYWKYFYPAFILKNDPREHMCIRKRQYFTVKNSKTTNIKMNQIKATLKMVNKINNI